MTYDIVLINTKYDLVRIVNSHERFRSILRRHTIPRVFASVESLCLGLLVTKLLL